MKATPGPWEWFVDWSGRIYLGTPNRGRLTVLDCVRSGMQSAVPRFAVWKGDERERMGGIMVPADRIELANHPDARLIAAAPCLIAACESMLAVYAPLYFPDSMIDAFSSAVMKARDAIAKARGE